MSQRTAVVGAGLAGIAAALERADRGDDVVLFEARPRLGGLAGSFRRGELPVDCGQHVFLGCCTAYRGLLERLGASPLVHLQDRLTIPLARPAREAGGEPTRTTLRRTGLPAPAHLLSALAGHRLLSAADRLRAARGALSLRRVDPEDPATDQRSFASWLADHGQNEATVEALWNLIGTAALNAPAADASLALAAMTFRTALLTEPRAGDIGWARVPLDELHDTAARRSLERANVAVRSGTRVRSLHRGDSRWVVTDSLRAQFPVDHVVLAVPPVQAELLLPGGAVGLPAGWGRRLGAVPIVNVHVRFDRPVLDVPLLAAVGSPAQWIFDRTESSGTQSGQYLAVSLSAAHDALGLSVARLREQMLPALADLLPAVRSARVLDCFVTRVPAATIDPGPGQAARRPAAATAFPGLVLAGAWTATGWPATMEGAVRSGQTAARLLDEPLPDTVAGPSAAPAAPRPVGSVV